jgi:hypothetical protein
MIEYNVGINPVASYELKRIAKEFPMSLNPAYKDLNRASTERIKKLASSLTDEEMQVRVGEHWTVAMALAHLAFWDRRVLCVLDMTAKEGKLSMPQIDIVVNDLLLPFWAAIPAREAARIAVEAAEELDRRLEEYPQNLLEEIHNFNQRWVNRAIHRNDHLDEVAAALKK